ncbi:MAG: hypothetical protein ACC631_10030 [Halocynthiibacter sp.]
MDIMLNSAEVAVLFRQDPATAGKGGFQDFLIRLQGKCDQTTGKILLSGDDLEKIPQYAFDYKNGGWQGRLLSIFERSLGPKLGRE